MWARVAARSPSLDVNDNLKHTARQAIEQAFRSQANGGRVGAGTLPGSARTLADTAFVSFKSAGASGKQRRPTKATKAPASLSAVQQ